MSNSRLQNISLISLLIALAIGQMWKIEPFHNTGGILILDLAVGVCWALLGWRIFQKDSLSVLKNKAVTKWYLAWLIALAISYLANFWHYGFNEQIVAFSYLFRLVLYTGLLFVGYQKFSEEPSRVDRYLSYATGALIILGAVIFFYLPDFSGLAEQGWDPHQGRLAGTWLDPNYFGSFLGIIFAYFLSRLPRLKDQPRTQHYWFIIFLIATWVAIYFTFSRSALITFLLTSLFVACFISWRTVVFILILGGLTIFPPSRNQDRLSSTLSYLQRKQTQGATSTDPTANARLASWNKAFQLFKTEPIFGVGYNFYRAKQAALMSNDASAILDNRSGAGADSSLLTLLATSGIVGAIVVIGFFIALFKVFWKSRRTVAGLGGLAILVGLLISSIFNNTALYAPILLVAILLLGVAWRQLPEN